MWMIFKKVPFRRRRSAADKGPHVGALYSSRDQTQWLDRASLDLGVKEAGAVEAGRKRSDGGPDCLDPRSHFVHGLAVRRQNGAQVFVGVGEDDLLGAVC